MTRTDVTACGKHSTTRSAGIRLAAVLVLIALAWHKTFAEMWLRWFPAWGGQTVSWLDRFTEGDSYYTHGPLVPLVSLVLAFFVYRRIGAPANRTRWSTVAGWITFVLGLLLHLASVYARVTFVSGFALIAVLAGLVLIWGGRPLLRAYCVPIAMLVFMVPLPMNCISELNFALKTNAGKAGVWLTTEVFAVPAVIDGSYVHLLPDTWGSPKTLVIENVCSGLRSLISLLWFAAIFAAICPLKCLGRLLLLALALPIAVGCNVIRITALSLAAHSYGVQAAGPGSWLHHISGAMVFVMAMALLLGIERAMLLPAKLRKRRGTELSSSPLQDVVPHITTDLKHPRPLLLTVLVLTALLSVLWSRPGTAQNVTQLAHQAVPSTFTLENRSFIGRDLELQPRTLIILETNDYLRRRFVEPQSGETVELLIIFSPDNRKGTHPPEVCSQGAGERIVQKHTRSLNITGLGTLTMSEFVSEQDAGPSRYHLYVYKCGQRYTNSFVTQQATIFLNGLMARNSSGALIHLTVPLLGRQVDRARQLALAAADALMPAIDKGLP